MIPKNAEGIISGYNNGCRLFVSESILNGEYKSLSGGVIYRAPGYSVVYPDHLSFLYHGFLTYKESKYDGHLTIGHYQVIEFIIGPDIPGYLVDHKFLMFKTKSELFEHILTKWPPIFIMRFNDDLKRLQEILV